MRTSPKFAGISPRAIAHGVKATVLKSALGALDGAGLLNKLVSRRLQSKAVVLMYHRVLRPEDMRSSLSQPGIIVSTITFEKHVRFLRENFKILSIEEFIDHISKERPFQDRSCLITFDDGWRDNYSNAFPILRKYNVPAVIFLSTGFIGTGRSFWQERLQNILDRIEKPVREDTDAVLADFPELGNELRRTLLAPGRLRPEEIAGLCASMKTLPQSRIDEILHRIEMLSKPNPGSAFDGREFLDWDEIKEMAAGGVGFGSHGVNHAILTVNADSAEAEIATSKVEIENRLWRDVAVFSYPNGNHSRQVVEMVKKSGYHAAFGTSFGYAAHNSDPFRIHRVNVHESSTSSLPLFLGRITGLC
jgi:peptidoglycan/xylan/chitin deacetylase (PgdA/CDA1 family)